MGKNLSVAVIGAGSWGTALAMVLANNGIQVNLYTRREDQKEEINHQHKNQKYLPGIYLPVSIKADTDLQRVVHKKPFVILVVPSHVMRETVRSMKEMITEDMILIHATKGLEENTYKRMSELIHEELPHLHENQIMVLSGPSHAEEVSRRSPTTVVVSGKDLNLVEKGQDLFINKDFRVYTNTDLIGVEIAGSLKNIIALGAGLSDGLGFGDNAKAALITRGLAEITRLGIELGANPLTFLGLAGVGDLVVTCTSKHSRNWRAGYQLGKGEKLEQILQQMGMVVEGVKTTRVAFALSQHYQVRMPITSELYRVLFEGKSPKQAVEDLMGRVKTHEMEEIAFEQLLRFD
ncbi:NAD(P)H-dependent glycerol-3-phosphate dehydrogenase [Tepidibacillus fermentans]|uniref:Glycerol-3-phosphate dehydrogenase [NAD(P)+] n=1 Tax=Tepidibacillus fermentans TaxID=1281767 RepID=A0A4R3KKV6_9BACI|nr:NAD(P)H-dependent glycerol-3-phosphate dehydrogenase [Tepidibacillus fermentans]TCS84130.1 glycerol-3-phosphate dehydrogenase (NAD(P)+) [Tepidibacillus fermentans]